MAWRPPPGNGQVCSPGAAGAPPRLGARAASRGVCAAGRSLHVGPPARNVSPVGSQLERREVVVAGVRRAYFSRGAPAETAGIVLCLHGSRSTAARQAWFTGMDSLQTDGLAVVYPQAEVPAGRGYAWDHERDLAYLATVVEQVRAELGAAASPVFLAGMSGGARMACSYAAARAEEVAAVAAVAGLRSPPVTPARPVPIIAFHGLADRINPYQGGRGERWRESVPEAAAAWAAANGVRVEPDRDRARPRADEDRLRRGDPCRGGALDVQARRPYLAR